MTSRQAGRRISSMAGKRRQGGTGRPSPRRSQPAGRREQRRFLQLMACGSIFILLVAVKLLLPGQMARINQKLSALLEQNMDVQAVFSAVGRAVSGETDGLAEEVYQAVFQPEPAEEALETAVTVPETPVPQQETAAPEQEMPPETEKAPEQPEQETVVSTLAYVLYSENNLPENVNLEQDLLGFDYCTPVMGTLTSDFGYREHPVEGEERFHYGVDIGAGSGTDIVCFADGTVTAVGESSSYGKYLTVAHEGGYSTLYAHCSRITASSGAAVKEGEKIAEVGETGIATGPHLHFELHREDTYLNPVYYVSLA